MASDPGSTPNIRNNPGGVDRNPNQGGPAGAAGQRGFAQTRQASPSYPESTRQVGVDPDDLDSYYPNPIRSNSDIPKRRSRRRMVILSILAVVLFGIIAGALSVRFALYSGSDNGTSVIVNIAQGSSTKQIGEALVDHEVIDSANVFQYYVRLTARSSIQAGSYELRESMSVADVVAALQEGPTNTIKLVIPEGKWVGEVVEIIAEQLPEVTEAELTQYLLSDGSAPKYRPNGIVCPQAVPLCLWEGLLFPSTYEIPGDAGAKEVVAILNNQLNQIADQVGLNDPAKLNGRDPYDVLIVASLVEGEAAVDEDRPMIAEVIYHRLSGDEPSNSWLGIDASVIYSLGQRNPGDGVIVARHKDPNDPYNTSALGGAATRMKLPLTPIAAPGKASIEAAMNPSSEGYKWYTLPDPNTNKHHFSKTKAEHDAADRRHDRKVAQGS